MVENNNKEMLEKNTSNSEEPSRDRSSISNKIESLGHFVASRSKTHNYPSLSFKAGFKSSPFLFIGYLTIFSYFASLITYIVLLFKSGINPVSIILSVFFLPLFVVLIGTLFGLALLLFLRLYLNMKYVKRIKDIEENLPTFLREFSTNLKAGREFVDALQDSKSDEIGYLNEDIDYIVKRIECGEPLGRVLSDYSEKYDSYTIDETFEIILESYTDGASLSDIIEKIADNIDTLLFLKKKSVASVSNYTFFIAFISLLIAPAMFAISINLLTLIESLLGKLLESGASSFLPSSVGSLDIDYGKFKLFSWIAVGVISVASASITSIIKNGNLKTSYKSLFVYLIASLVSYNICVWLFSAIFTMLMI